MNDRGGERASRVQLDPVRASAGRILLRWKRGHQTIEELLEHETGETQLDHKARSRLRELLFGCMHLLGRHEFVLRRHARRGAKMPDAAWVCLVLALQEIEEMRTPDHAAVDQAVLLCRRLGAPHAARFVNGLLRTALREGLSKGLPDAELDPIGHAIHALSHPEWIVRRWATALGPAEMLRLCATNNRRPDLVLRCSPGRRDAVGAQLTRLAIEWEATRAPDGLRLVSRLPVPDLLFELGESVAVQDEAAQCVAPLLAMKSPALVVDLCAAPGGKSCHLAQLLPNARIVAMDASAARLARVAANAQRLRLPNVETVVADARRPPLLPSSVEAILLDAPCLGTGVMARRHDLRWRRREADLQGLTLLQRQLLDAAAALLKPGAMLVYATCSLEPEENERIVEGALERHPELEEIAADDAEIGMDTRPDVSFFDGGRLRIWPQRHGCDGAFAARLRRRA
jgi:16S rRNA (cytosine967-C5)-methyltransferase